MSGTSRDAALLTRAARRLALQFGAVIALILVIVGIVVWLVIRGRRSPGSTDSDVPTER